MINQIQYKFLVVSGVGVVFFGKRARCTYQQQFATSIFAQVWF
ncbi:hypothetical protein [Lederbergia panacisoli]|nr:hypothetical protein [Lederbergia panacisoli]MCR2822109.1 hypothetical protein [Lederbergia panacisoli]